MVESTNPRGVCEGANVGYKGKGPKPNLTLSRKETFDPNVQTLNVDGQRLGEIIDWVERGFAWNEAFYNFGQSAQIPWKDGTITIQATWDRGIHIQQ